MKNILILCGKAASGKDTLKRYIVEALELSGIEFNNVVNTTTRPPREGEVDGVNYHFCSAEEMTKKILNDEMAEAVLFNDWVYGTENKALSEDKLNVGIFNLEGIEALR